MTHIFECLHCGLIFSITLDQPVTGLPDHGTCGDCESEIDEFVKGESDGQPLGLGEQSPNVAFDRREWDFDP